MSSREKCREDIALLINYQQINGNTFYDKCRQFRVNAAITGEGTSR